MCATPASARTNVHTHTQVRFLRFVLSRATLPATWSAAHGDAAPELDSDDSDR